MQPKVYHKQGLKTHVGTILGSHGPIYGGVIYIAKKMLRLWYFICKKLENIICDDILHVNMFHYLKSPILHVHFLQNLSTINILDPIFHRTLFYNFRQ